MSRDENYDSWPEILAERKVEEGAVVASLSNLELGLRWLHDRARECYVCGLTFNTSDKRRFGPKGRHSSDYVYLPPARRNAGPEPRYAWHTETRNTERKTALHGRTKRMGKVCYACLEEAAQDHGVMLE